MIANQFKLVRLVTSAIDALRDTTQRQIEAIREFTQVQKASDEPPPAQRISGEVTFPPAEIKRYYSEQDKTYRLQRRTFWVSALTLLALALYTYVTYRQWRTMNETYQEIVKQTDAAIKASAAAAKAAGAASDQVTLMKQQLETQGAYVQVGMETRTSPRLLPKDFTYPIGITVLIQNIGATEASDLRISMVIALKPAGRSGMREKRVSTVDFTIPSVESYAPMLGMPTPQHPMTRREFSFVLTPEEASSVINGNASLRSEGTVTYMTAFNRRIREPICWAFWEHWLTNKTGDGASQGGGQTSTCSDFDNSWAPRIPEIIRNHVKQEQ